ncbi:thyroid peroxidase [Stegostoma tigrinum]|uniref:thyroid peroxidase n=1 Tax=Stegostoma tigrinum TaxID=3053191 RepID=UPI00202B1C4B|nr:thyroid peroxidase [Stegostoma tigrinum]
MAAPIQFLVNADYQDLDSGRSSDRSALILFFKMRFEIMLGIAIMTGGIGLVFHFNKEGEVIVTEYLEKLGDSFLPNAIQEGINIVDNAIHQTMKRAIDVRKLPSSTELLSFSKRPGPESKKISRAAEIMEMSLYLIQKKVHQKHKRSANSTDLLSLEVLNALATTSGCLPHMQPLTCSNNCFVLKYRLINGTCNNRNNPRWGSTNSALARWLPPEYEDGFSQPKGWNPEHLYRGFKLPLVRDITNKILRTSVQTNMTEDHLYSHILVEWGQYIAHDFAFTPQSISQAAFVGGVDCGNTCQNLNPCFPIKALQNDPHSKINECITFYRSSPSCGTGDQQTLFEALSNLNSRQQINAVTSFIDASTVYGSTAAHATRLRDHSSKKGLLLANKRYKDGNQELLPFIDQVPSPCIQAPNSTHNERIECFLAGEGRANEVLTLASMHTLWMREHNRLAKALHRMNSHWNSETIYQETRKIIGALHQIITMRDYIPKILGSQAFDQLLGKYDGYDETLNPTLSNVFATAAFRFGHATISPKVQRFDENFKEHPKYPSLDLHDTFFSPWRIIKEGGLNPLFRGLLTKPAKLQTSDQMMVEELTEKLFTLTSATAMDLASLNLQRGRDHGLPGYNDWREYCELERLETKANLRKAISDLDLVEKIMDLYGHPNNIDIWLGGLAEDFLPGARIGPLFACLIGKQMKTLREGDRFWWENPGVFTSAQRYELAQHSLSRVICDNTAITEVPLDAFRFGKYPQGFVQCDQVPGLNLEAWHNKPQQVTFCEPPPPIENGAFVLCTNSGQSIISYICHHGFHLFGPEELICSVNGWSSDPPVCKDINECEDATRPACHSSATCANTKGSYTCICSDASVISEDGHNCIDYKLRE